MNVISFYLGYLHVCPQSMQEEGVEGENAALAGQGLTGD